MNKVKYVTGTLIAALLLLVGFNTMAQSWDAAGKLAQKMIDSLAYLQLTPQQTPNALALNQTAATGLLQTAQKAKTDTSFRGKAQAQQVMGIMKQRNAGLQKILTSDQQKVFQQHKVSQIADVQTKVMTAQLSLTEEQVPQVYKLNEKETGEMMKDLNKVQNSKGKLGKLKGAKGIKGDTKDKDAALKKILTPDQYSIYEKHAQEMQAAMKEKMQEKKGK